MSLIDLIKSACGSSDDKEYDVYGQPTTFVNPFAKDKILEEHKAGKNHDEVEVEVDKQEGYAIDAEFADKAARLMNEHTQAVIDMIKGSWKTEREDLMKQVEAAKKQVEDVKDQMQANEANRRQAQSRANDMSARISEVEAEREKFEIENKSLQSRLKAMEVKGGVDKLNAQIDGLNADVERLQKELDEKTAEADRLAAVVSAAQDGPSVEDLTKQIQQRDELIEKMRTNNSELQEQLNAQGEELKGVEELQAAFEEVEQFKEKKNAEIASLRSQVADYKTRDSEFDEMRKNYIVIKEDKERLNREVEELKAIAKQNAEVQNRRNIDTANIIDDLKRQLAVAKANADDINNRYNALNADGNEKQANFAKIAAERDDAKAELKRAKVLQEKLMHEAQAMKDAIAERDMQIAALQQSAANGAQKSDRDPLGNDIPFDAGEDAFIDDTDENARPPHPGDDAQLSLF